MSGSGDGFDDSEVAFKVWVNNQPHGETHMGSRGAIIKIGRYVMKTVMIADYGDKSTGELKKRKLRFRTLQRDKFGGWDFDNPDPKTTWWCENDEIGRLLAYLQSEIAETGRYRVVNTESADSTILSLLHNGDVSPATLAEALIQHGDLKQLVAQLTSGKEGISVAQAAVVARRRELVAKLRKMVQSPGATETDVQQVIQDAYWIFGGQYVGVADRRNLMSLDQHDIPLLGADGTLHIVELKGPNIPKLVRLHRNHWIVGDDVHEAVGQAMNYVRSFDELGASASTNYRNELGHDYDMRRVFATVVIGHPCHITDKKARVATERTICQTIRSYNAHLSRVEVMTYKDLVDAAERALAFEEEATLAKAAENSTLEQEDNARDGFGDIPSKPDPWNEETPF